MSGVVGNVIIQGNRIGTSIAGLAAVPNAKGVTLAATGGLNNIIGGTTGVNPNNSCTGACNLISGNTSTGIGITGEKAAVKGNYIGANVSRTAPQ